MPTGCNRVGFAIDIAWNQSKATILEMQEGEVITNFYANIRLSIG
jgi:hypothetical protein